MIHHTLINSRARSNSREKPDDASEDQIVSGKFIRGIAYPNLAIFIVIICFLLCLFLMRFILIPSFLLSGNDSEIPATVWISLIGWIVFTQGFVFLLMMGFGDYEARVHKRPKGTPELQDRDV